MKISHIFCTNSRLLKDNIKNANTSEGNISVRIFTRDRDGNEFAVRLGSSIWSTSLVKRLQGNKYKIYFAQKQGR